MYWGDEGRAREQERERGGKQANDREKLSHCSQEQHMELSTRNDIVCV